MHMTTTSIYCTAVFSISDSVDTHRSNRHHHHFLFMMMLFCSLSNRHAFALVDAKTGQKQTDIVDMNRREARATCIFSSSSSFPVSLRFFPPSSLLEITSSLSLVTASISSIPSLSLSLSIWCALPTSRKLTVRKKATHRFYCIKRSTKRQDNLMGSDTSKSKKRATQLTEDEIQLLLRNTHFNRQQIKEWHQGFLVSERNI